MTRRIVGVLAIALMFWACRDVTGPGTGSLAIHVVSGPGNSFSLADSWRLTVSGPADRTVSGAPGATVTVSNLPVGVYDVTIEGFTSGVVTDRGSVSGVSVRAGSPTTVQVPITKTTILDVSPTSVTFSASVGGSDPAPQVVSVSNAGAGSLGTVSASISFSGTDRGWLSASATSTAITLSATTGTLPAGTHTATVAVNATSAENTPQNVSVTFEVASAVTSSVGGIVTGLLGTVVLQNNGGDDLTVTADGSFTFATALVAGSAYAVTVLTQPAGQMCSVANGSGTIGGTDITNVQVTCSTNFFTIGGTVTGLSGTVVLQNNGGDDLTVTADGSFTFTTSLADGSPYAVTVLTQPAGQTCTVTNGGGTVSGADVTAVQIICATNFFTVGGTVSGLLGTVVLQNNGGDDLSVSASGSFAFATALADGSPYLVTVLTQPAGQTCSVANGSGSLSGADITTVQVTCATSVFTVGGSVAGLAGTVVLQNNGGDDLTVTTAGNFTFATALADGSPYAVTVLTQPNLQTCTVTSGSGTLSGANVTNVLVTCVTNFSIGGAVTGLVGTVVLQNNGGDDLTVTAAGGFFFPTPLPDGSAYVVTVLTQPMFQTCSVTNGNGTLAGGNVTNVLVTCATNFFTVGGDVSGLTGTVVLQNNGGDDLTVTASGPFTFATALADGSAFAVTVLTQPAGETCSVTSGSGALSGADVTTVVVTCATNLFTVGGTVTGLTGTVVLQNNGGDDLSVSADGSFTFATPLADLSPYAVTVLTQPAGQTCNVTSGSGTVSGADVTSVQVACSTNFFTVGGTVTGLTGTVVLQNNGGDDLSVSADGSFTFATPLADLSPYAVTVLTQPAGQTCNVTSGSGNLTGANVTSVQVACSTNFFTVGGTVAGLTGTVVLQNNGGDDLSVSADGSFTFATPLVDLSPYAVTVLTQPASQTCNVTSGSGTVSGADVTTVVVTCATNFFTVGGTVTGLTGTVVLQNNGGDDLSVSADGSFTFATSLADLSSYAVTVLTQPAGQTCTVTNGNGNLAGANITSVQVACSTNFFTVGGTVTGLTGTVVLQNNGGDDLSVSADGSFTFATSLADLSSYAVTVLTQPAGQTCTVTNGSGNLAGANVTSVQVACSTNLFTVGGTVAGLTGTVVLQNNGGDDLSVSADGSFTFATPLVDLSPYAVTVLTQPAGQTCNVTSGSGTVSGANVTTVVVTCATNFFTVGGTVTGLTGTVVLQNNGGDDLSVSADGSFTFATSVADLSPYAVTVVTQPAGQTCTVTNGSGSLAGANVTSVQVTCLTDFFTVGGIITGLVGTVVLQNNGGDDLSVSSNGSFTFATPLADLSSYAVTVLTQPAGQTCTVTSGSGTLNGGKVTDVRVNCT